MNGYHYTSLENWKKIKKEGLEPYLLNHQEVWREHFDYPVEGVWLWKEKPDPKSHFGNILWQIYTKGTSKVVFLEVTYNEKDTLVPPDEDDTLEITHTLTVGEFIGHIGDESAVVIKTIKPKDIKLLKTYDLVEIVWGAGEKND